MKSDFTSSIEFCSSIRQIFENIAIAFGKDGYCDWEKIGKARDEIDRLIVEFSASRTNIISEAYDKIENLEKKIKNLEKENNRLRKKTVAYSSRIIGFNLPILERGTPNQIIDWINSSSLRVIRGHTVPFRFTEEEIIYMLKAIKDDSKRVAFSNCCFPNYKHLLKGK